MNITNKHFCLCLHFHRFDFGSGEICYKSVILYGANATVGYLHLQWMNIGLLDS